MTNAIDLAQQILDRLNGVQVQAEFTLPEMTAADTIVWLDSLRIPEKLAYIDRCVNITPEARASMGHYIQEKEAERDHWLEMLADLKESCEAGEISQADYDRIDTPQNYSPEHLQGLRQHVNRFLPQYHGMASNGLPVYSFTDQNRATVWLTNENGQWVKHDGYPTQFD